jgi:hypothetical protein
LSFFPRWFKFLLTLLKLERILEFSGQHIMKLSHAESDGATCSYNRCLPLSPIGVQFTPAWTFCWSGAVGLQPMMTLAAGWTSSNRKSSAGEARPAPTKGRKADEDPIKEKRRYSSLFLSQDRFLKRYRGLQYSLRTMTAAIDYVVRPPDPNREGIVETLKLSQNPEAKKSQPGSFFREQHREHTEGSRIPAANRHAKVAETSVGLRFSMRTVSRNED